MLGKFKLGFGTNAYQKYGIQETIQKISEFGYDGIDLMADRPHAYPVDLDKKMRQELKGIVEAENLKIANINASSVSAAYEEEIGELRRAHLPPELTHFCKAHGFISTSEKYRKRRIEYIEQSIDLAADLEVLSVSTFSGIRPPRIPPEDAWKWLREGLEECLNYAEEKDVNVALEPEPSHFIERIADVSAVFDKIENKDLLRVNLDIAHCYCVEKSINSMVKAIQRELKDKIAHTHIADIKNKKHYHLIPSEGDIGNEGLKEIITALRKADYKGFLTVEVYTYTLFPDYAAKQAISNLKEIVRSIDNQN